MKFWRGTVDDFITEMYQRQEEYMETEKARRRRNKYTKWYMKEMTHPDDDLLRPNKI